MFVEKPSMKKGAQKSVSLPKDGGGMKTMEHCSKLLAGKSLEPKQRNGKEYFGNPK